MPFAAVSIALTNDTNSPLITVLLLLFDDDCGAAAAVMKLVDAYCVANIEILNTTSNYCAKKENSHEDRLRAFCDAMTFCAPIDVAVHYSIRCRSMVMMMIELVVVLSHSCS